ncbi:protein-disulfide reductase DsbD family protein [Chitinophagaceae bacterium LB-8]|uniref:Protein-disulfide reductase DsbD family protein n=1 Tax=Paraflavisolibacter caeni TaxID=2982496 RepID=A0A9X2XXP6_9BACT|nr:protein-disulfide reductase DsbD domain-containing protein [Paraflavisolibacter caeni]MCU7550487.1 protein-disulfide reductase DsbD family protein [Paraflavisolibacter caeni]
MAYLWIFILPIQLFWGHQTVSDIVKVKVPEAIVYAGKRSLIKVELEVKNGYHIQANKTKDEFIIPTTLEIKTYEGIRVERTVFPPANKFQLEGTNTYLDVYDGVFSIIITVQTNRNIQRQRHVLQAKLNYQACDNQRCLMPKTIEFSIQVEVK